MIYALNVGCRCRTAPNLLFFFSLRRYSVKSIQSLITNNTMMRRACTAMPVARRLAAAPCAAVVAARPASTVAISVQGLHYVGTGLAAIALAGVGLGIGTIFGNLLVACARQPNMTRMLFNYAILGFALTEAIGLFALMLAFLMLFS